MPDLGRSAYTSFAVNVCVNMSIFWGHMLDTATCTRMHNRRGTTHHVLSKAICYIPIVHVKQHAKVAVPDSCAGLSAAAVNADVCSEM